MHWISLLMLLLIADPAQSEQRRDKNLRVDTMEYTSIDEVIDTYFRSVSGPAGPRDWRQLKNLTLPTAQFNAMGINSEGENAFYPQTRDEYIAHLEEHLKKSGFYQREIARRTVQYSRMAHVLSTYESRSRIGAPLMDRGLISFQLVNKEGRWWIVNVLWHSETQKHPLPEEHLEQWCTI